jgi:hypothetical protein
MKVAKMVAMAKRIAAIVLAVCFVLPLSQCDVYKVNPLPEKSMAAPSSADGKQSRKVTVLYGFDLAAEGYAHLADGKLDGAGKMLIAFAVFFLPIGCLWLGKRLQPSIILLAAFSAGYLLSWWVFVFGTARFGGLLAVACWTTLVVASLIDVWLLWRGRRKKARSVPGLASQTD